MVVDDERRPAHREGAGRSQGRDPEEPRHPDRRPDGRGRRLVVHRARQRLPYAAAGRSRRHAAADRRSRRAPHARPDRRARGRAAFLRKPLRRAGRGRARAVVITGELLTDRPTDCPQASFASPLRTRSGSPTPPASAPPAACAARAVAHPCSRPATRKAACARCSKRPADSRPGLRHPVVRVPGCRAAGRSAQREAVDSGPIGDAPLIFALAAGTRVKAIGAEPFRLLRHGRAGAARLAAEDGRRPQGQEHRDQPRLDRPLRHAEGHHVGRPEARGRELPLPRAGRCQARADARLGRCLGHLGTLHRAGRDQQAMRACWSVAAACCRA